MTSPSTTDQTSRLVCETQLHCFVTISIYGLDLQNMAGTCLNNSNRNRSSVLLENLCHSDLSAEYTFAHRFFP